MSATATPRSSRPTSSRRGSRFSCSWSERARPRRVVMESTSAVLRPPLTRDETGSLLGQTMGLVAATTGLFALGAYLGRDVSYGWGWLIFIAAFGVLLGMNVAVQRSERLAV